MGGGEGVGRGREGTHTQNTFCSKYVRYGSQPGENSIQISV